jgi:phosphoribosylamine--glycine ligase
MIQLLNIFLLWSFKNRKTEGSKEFVKEFLIKHNIPTAAYDSFIGAEP